jgi:hypothetical protein
MRKASEEPFEESKDPNPVSQYYRTFNVVQFAKKLDGLLDLLHVTADALAATWDQRADQRAEVCAEVPGEVRQAKAETLLGASCPINSVAPVLAIPGMVADCCPARQEFDPVGEIF